MNKNNRPIVFLVTILAGTVLLMVLGPFTIFTHYIFGLLALIMMIVVQLPKKIAVIIVALLSMYWVTRLQFVPARISTRDRLACVHTICQQFPQPIYVVTNSASHDHQGLGYAYLAEQMGCDMFAVTQWTDQRPKIMAVMNENTRYDMLATDFYELNRFGERKFNNEIQCGNNLTITLFSK